MNREGVVIGSGGTAKERSVDLLIISEALAGVARELLGPAPLQQKADKVLEYVFGALDGQNQRSVWLELDGVRYGKPASCSTIAMHTEEVRVDDQPRGMLYAAYHDGALLDEKEVELLQETATLLGWSIRDLEEKLALTESEKRSRRLANRLQKEMIDRAEALAGKTSYLEGILRSSEDAIITTDLEARIVEFNPGAERILGYSTEEMKGRKVGDIWENAEERDKILESVTESGGVRNYETRLKTKHGEFKEISLTLSRLRDDQGRVLGTVGISKDITEEKAVKRELELLNRNFRETLHFINHEFKNSLMVIGGFVRRLMDSEDDPGRLEQLKIVYSHSKFLEAMALDFLVYAELEHGEFQIRKRPVNNFYEDVILPAMVGLKERYPDSFQSYDTTMGGVGQVELAGDPNLLRIVYRNLFGNALKYRRTDGKISYGVEHRPRSYLFNVWNEGPGVPKTEVEQIFEKFYRVPDETTREKRGTGLGLYNIRRIIEAHGGTIWCESEPGKWINFLFTLPKD